MADPFPNADAIHLRDLRARCVIGTLSHERADPQEVIFNVTLFGDLAPAGRSDRLEQTIDYSRIERELVKMAQSSCFYLLERLAAEAATVCLADPMVHAVRLTVDKPAALRACRSVAVEIVRRRP